MAGASTRSPQAFYAAAAPSASVGVDVRRTAVRDIDIARRWGGR